MPVLTDGGQDLIAIAGEICGCILEGMPNLTDAGQDNIAVVIEICGCVLEGMSCTVHADSAWKPSSREVKGQKAVRPV